MRLIQVDLLGGLGNQLFGEALALALAGRNTRIKITISNRMIPLGSNPSRNLEVDKLNLVQSDRVFFRKSSGVFLGVLRRNKFLRRLWWKLTRIHERGVVIDSKSIWSCELRSTKKVVFSDYFNDWFFPELAIKLGTLKNKPSLVSNSTSFMNSSIELASDEVVLVHIRIGDYLQFPEVFTLLPESYYFEALKSVSSQSYSEVRIIILCESAIEVKRFYPNLADRAELIIDKKSGFTDSESFVLLCNARKLIAANSTYSIWAAWFVQLAGWKAVVPVKNFQVARDEGFIYLDWEVFDLSTFKIMERDTNSKSSWMALKTEQLDRLLHQLVPKQRTD